MLFLAKRQWKAVRERSSFAFQNRVMHTKQTIAIIGASGNMGRVLSIGLAKGHYRLLLLDSSLEQGKALREEIVNAREDADVEVIDCYVEACWEADIILIAIPTCREQEVAGKIREMANQKIVLGITGQPQNDKVEQGTAPGNNRVESLQALLPHSKVVKAKLCHPETDPSHLGVDNRQGKMVLTGDDSEALETVSELLTLSGFKTVLEGGFTGSKYQEQTEIQHQPADSQY